MGTYDQKTFSSKCPHCKSLVEVSLQKRDGYRHACPDCLQYFWAPRLGDVLNTGFRNRNAAMLSDDKPGIVAQIFPYLKYFALSNGCDFRNHVTLESSGLNGTNIYRRDDPVWVYFTPPWEPGCGCTTTIATVDAAADAGVSEAIQWRKTDAPPTHPEYCFKNPVFSQLLNPSRLHLGPYLSEFFEPYSPGFFEFDEEDVEEEETRVPPKPTKKKPN